MPGRVGPLFLSVEKFGQCVIALLDRRRTDEKDQEIGVLNGRANPSAEITAGWKRCFVEECLVSCTPKCKVKLPGDLPVFRCVGDEDPHYLTMIGDLAYAAHNTGD